MAEVAGFGTTLSYSTTQGGSYTALAEVVDLTPPEAEVDDIENTHMLSTDKWKTFQGGLKDLGEAECVIHFDKTILATLYTTLLAADYWYKVTFSDGSTLGFAGYLKNIGPETPIDDIVTVSLTFKASGAPTFTAAS